MTKQEVFIKDEYIKLSQLLKFLNLCNSGGEAKQAISEGLVKVNGQVEFKKGKKIYKNDIVELKGFEIKIK